MRTRTLPSVLALSSLLVLLVGCFFETRTPPPPELGGGCGFDFVANDSWENVLINLEGALECGDAAEYLKMLSPNFLFVPSQTVAAQNPQVFAEVWNYDREELFINETFATARFRADLDSMIVSTPVENGSITTLTATYRIQEIDADGVDVGPAYRDAAEYEFFRDASGFTLLSWRDTESIENARPFGERRGDQGGGV